MELFGADPAANLLPCDGEVNYFGPVLSPGAAGSLYECLLHTIPWKSDEVVLFGKRIITARKVAWYGDANFSYTYSGTTKQALIWTPELAALRTLIQTLTGDQYNSCLLNLYQSGNEGMGWHSDDEKSLDRKSSIASVSFGAIREFRFKHKVTGVKAAVQLDHGSLLVMRPGAQTHWLHSLPKTAKVGSPRINLTFRTMAF